MGSRMHGVLLGAQLGVVPSDPNVTNHGASRDALCTQHARIIVLLLHAPCALTERTEGRGQRLQGLWHCDLDMECSTCAEGPTFMH